MILTESDLHAYNRGELPPDAVRQLQEDPLAMQDAARLRSLSRALQQEKTIPVVGRAETLERLRSKSRPRVGVPGWVWAVGTACVIGLAVISIPHETRSQYGVRFASYTRSDASVSAPSELPRSASPASEAQPRDFENAGSVVPMADRASPALQDQNAAMPKMRTEQSTPRARTAALDLLVGNVPAAQAKATAEVKRLGGAIVETSPSASTRLSGVTLTIRVPEGNLSLLVANVSSLGRVRAESNASQSVVEELAETRSKLARLESSRAQARPALDGDGGDSKRTFGARETSLRHREQVEELRSELNALEDRAARATLRLTLRER